MIDEIQFIQYRKLKEITFRFNPRINLISGTNGTCKSTLMHIVGNSFQSVKTTSEHFTGPAAINVLKKFVDKINPKIETVSRGDKSRYSNPAEGRAGTLFTVKYIGGEELEFRRHNSKNDESKKHFRFSIKPKYAKDTEDRLPSTPVAYLGLSRLVPYGEVSDKVVTSTTRDQFPPDIQAAFVKQFAELTRMEIDKPTIHNIPDVKKRSDFTTNIEGIDSNTISSGEDNIGIILTALNCLRYVSENVVKDEERDIESVLLIDEFDATLHPTAQKKLFDIIVEYAEKYRIQVFFTTHSLFILKYGYQLKKNIIYLVDQLDSVSVMPDPSPVQIEMHLTGLQHTALYQNVFIPVYTEDAEARFFLEQIMDYISKTLDPGFAAAKDLLHLVNANIGADNLQNLFRDLKMNRSTMRAICILDGDQEKDLTHHIIALPGGQPPDRMFSEFLRSMMNDGSARAFWHEVLPLGYSKLTADDVLKDFDAIDVTINERKQLGQPTKGFRRELSKDHFNKHRPFYDLIIKAWLKNDANKTNIEKFRNDLYAVFKKTAGFHSVDDKIWPQQVKIKAA
ncbi:AAA family ATPase [Agrobacterium rosae]|uniref:AAA family ATPase n=1 Tax=Agrobacterium rosae TaxID=1972867 RepID=UPI003A810A96